VVADCVVANSANATDSVSTRVLEAREVAKRGATTAQAAAARPHPLDRDYILLEKRIKINNEQIFVKKKLRRRAEDVSFVFFFFCLS
jgi:hypothetical protein